MTLRLRRSSYMNEYFKGQQVEEKEMQALLGGFGQPKTTRKKTAKRK
jgi:hypothetical protein